MGKQNSPRSPRPEPLDDDLSLRMKECQIRSSENGNDPSIGRRMSGGDNHWNSKMVLPYGWKNDNAKYTTYSLMVSIFDSTSLETSSVPDKPSGLKEDDRDSYIEREKSPVHMYDRLLNLASSALTEKEFRQEPSNFWNEPYDRASIWKPCADRKPSTSLGRHDQSNGYILVSANGGLNQQRVAICNAVAVASLLNATLVLPRFLYSNVWKDPSQFGDIYQETYFMDIMKDEIDIVKELPPDLKSVEIEAVGSLITDSDIVKEAKPVDYIRIVLPILLKNRVVHFLGFGNRLGFDPLPFELQRLRCKCNFHALKFVPKIQQVGSLLVRRIRKYDAANSMLDKQLFGKFMPSFSYKEHEVAKGPSKYLALHLRFEVDMVAYSLCEFGGGDTERKELQTYREIHFPLLIERLKKSKPVSPTELRKLGRCPLTPEEAALVLAGLGFKRGTYIYLAGSHVYGGKSRMQSFTSLYPNLVTKESLLTHTELAPFRNFSSQLAALDFIACASADVFAMTDSGSQLSSLVSGYRTYYGEGHAPSLRPNKKRLAQILSDNSTIEWNSFEDRVKKMIEEGQRIRVRGFGRSIYRQPRCPECMCKSQ
nr:O-fucosyltransferase 8 isoform X2 [Ziziphus jujuba var. spinosa]